MVFCDHQNYFVVDTHLKVLPLGLKPPYLFRSGELSLSVQPEASELKRFAFHGRSGKRHRVRSHLGKPRPPKPWALQTVFVEISASKYDSMPTAVVNPLWQDEKIV